MLLYPALSCAFSEFIFGEFKFGDFHQISRTAYVINARLALQVEGKSRVEVFLVSEVRCHSTVVCNVRYRYV
jgi:hypothetical protein